MYRGTFWGLLALIGLVLCLNGCSSSPKRNPFAGVGSPVYKGAGPLPKGGGRYLVGEPYEVAGWKYFPREDPTYDKVGPASWYGPQFHRRMTSNGEWFDMEYLSAAHPTLPLPSYVRVTNLENGRSVVVRVNDRGPFVGDRIIDMSRKSAEVLGFKEKGKATVRVKYLGPAPLDDKGGDLIAMNRGSGETAVAGLPVAREAAPQPRSNYMIQVGAYADPANAERARSALGPVGPVSVTPVAGQLGTIYKVELGPLAGRDRAAAALDEVIAHGHVDARVVTASNWPISGR